MYSDSLNHAGKPIENGFTVSHYGLSAQCTLRLVLSLRAGMFRESSARNDFATLAGTADTNKTLLKLLLPNGVESVLEIDNGDEIANLKKRAMSRYESSSSSDTDNSSAAKPASRKRALGEDEEDQGAVVDSKIENLRAQLLGAELEKDLLRTKKGRK